MPAAVARWSVVGVLVLLLTGYAAEHGPNRSSGGSGTSTETAVVADYAHLGDSYAAGVGLQPLVADSPFPCLRAQDNYGELLARRRGWTLVDVSCGGARTENLTRGQYEGVGPQLDALGPQIRVVTLTLGGNDGDVFATAVGECTRLGHEDPDGDPCRRALGVRLLREIDSRTRPDLEAGLKLVRERAPHARVLITGYPWLLPPTGGCFDEVSVAAGDVRYLRRLQQRLNDAVEAAARGAGAQYVDVSEVSTGHDACAGRRRWIEPMGAGSGSLHPNAAGQRAMADAVAAALRD